MQSQNGSRYRFVLRGIALGLLSLLAIAPSLPAMWATNELVVLPADDQVGTAAAPGQEKEIGTQRSLPHCAQPDVALPEEFGVALEDSDEMFRGETQRRQSFGIDDAMIASGVTAKITHCSGAIISPPLLV